jgi:hypothetical protein
MKARTKQETELTTFVIDKLKSERGRRELVAFLRDTAELMVDCHDIDAIAVNLRYARIALYDRH